MWIASQINATQRRYLYVTGHSTPASYCFTTVSCVVNAFTAQLRSVLFLSEFYRDTAVASECSSALTLSCDVSPIVRDSDISPLNDFPETFLSETDYDDRHFITRLLYKDI